MTHTFERKTQAYVVTVQRRFSVAERTLVWDQTQCLGILKSALHISRAFHLVVAASTLRRRRRKRGVMGASSLLYSSNSMIRKDGSKEARTEDASAEGRSNM